MITFAAIKKDDGVIIIGEKGQRHSDILFNKKYPVVCTNIVKGFVDENNNFYNRHEAAIHAFSCGQLPYNECPEYLISEDLF